MGKTGVGDSVDHWEVGSVIRSIPSRWWLVSAFLSYYLIYSLFFILTCYLVISLYLQRSHLGGGGGTYRIISPTNNAVVVFGAPSNKIARVYYMDPGKRRSVSIHPARPPGP